MAADSLNEQLVKYLTDVHAMEVQALAQMRRRRTRRRPAAGVRVRDAPHRDRAPRVADPRAPPGPRRRAVADRGPARQAQRQGVRAVRAGSTRTRPASSPRTPSRTSTWSSPRTTCSRRWPAGGRRGHRGRRARASAPRRRRWRCGSASSWDRAVEASLKEARRRRGDARRRTWPTRTRWRRSPTSCSTAGRSIVGTARARTVLENHHAETHRHLEHLERRLADRGGSPSRVKDAALKLGALNWGGFLAAQPDTPAKLAMFAYAVRAPRDRRRTSSSRAWRGWPATGRRRWWPTRSSRRSGRPRSSIFGAFDEALDASLEAAHRGRCRTRCGSC